MITVGIISPRITLEAINQVVDHENFGCVFRKYIYEKLEEIASIYEKCREDGCDVIFCSGELGYSQLCRIEGNKLPCSFVLYEDKHVLSIFLNFVIEHPEIPLNRVYCDFLTPLNEFMHFDQYLASENMPYCFESCNYVYEELIERARELWESGKIDILITRCTNILGKFDELGIPYLHLLPSKLMITESINNALNHAKLKHPDTDYQVCVIIKLLYPEQLPIQEQEFYAVTIHKNILDFRKLHKLAFTVRPSSDRFEITGDGDDYRKITQTIQELLSFLTDRSEIEFRLGAGIADSADESHYQAEIALLESIKYGKNDGFLIKHNDSFLTGPLSMTHALNYSYTNLKALDYARENGINESNLLKIVGLYRMNSADILTAASLSKWLNITPRSCNRIISQLLESSLLEETEPLKQETKGRPTRQYRFCRQSFEKVFF